MGHAYISALGGILFVVLLCFSSYVSAEFTSCAQIAHYFRGKTPSHNFDKSQQLKAAFPIIKQAMTTSDDVCSDPLIDRVFFEYAEALDKFSQTLNKTAPGSKKWATDAAKAYNEYIEWFLDLSKARQNALVKVWAKERGVSESDFDENERRKSLRKRMGNVLQALGACFVRADTPKELLDSYSRYTQQQQNIEIFPDEVVDEWYKWLQVLPDWQSKPDKKIQTLIVENPQCSKAWRVFKTLLTAYTQANPSVQDDWYPILQKVTKWLSGRPTDA